MRVSRFASRQLSKYLQHSEASCATATGLRIDWSRVGLSWVIAATQSLVININWAWKSSERMRTRSPKIAHNKDELIKRSNDQTLQRSYDRSSVRLGDEWSNLFCEFCSFFFGSGSGLWHPIKKRNWVRHLLILSAQRSWAGAGQAIVAVFSFTFSCDAFLI